MKIIKRSGAEVSFDPQKIVIAVSKANDSVVPSARMSAVQIRRIAEDVESAAQNIGPLLKRGRDSGYGRRSDYEPARL